MPRFRWYRWTIAPARKRLHAVQLMAMQRLQCLPVTPKRRRRSCALVDYRTRGNNGENMTIVLRPEQEQLLQEAIRSGLAQNTDEALDQALDSLRYRLPKPVDQAESTPAIARRLASFGKRRGLSLGGSTVKDLLRESRP